VLFQTLTVTTRLGPNPNRNQCRMGKRHVRAKDVAVTKREQRAWCAKHVCARCTKKRTTYAHRPPSTVPRLGPSRFGQALPPHRKVARARGLQGHPRGNRCPTDRATNPAGGAGGRALAGARGDRALWRSEGALSSGEREGMRMQTQRPRWGLCGADGGENRAQELLERVLLARGGGLNPM